MADDIYIKLVRNEKKTQQSNLIGLVRQMSLHLIRLENRCQDRDTWHNQAGWDGEDGMITIRLRANDKSKSGSSGGGHQVLHQKKIMQNLATMLKDNRY